MSDRFSETMEALATKVKSTRSADPGCSSSETLRTSCAWQKLKRHYLPGKGSFTFLTPPNVWVTQMLAEQAR